MIDEDVTVTALFSPLAAAAVAGASRASAAARRTITVQGTGIVTTVPNEAQFTFGVSVTAPTAKAALTANARRMNALIAAIKARASRRRRSRPPRSR